MRRTPGSTCRAAPRPPANEPPARAFPPGPASPRQRGAMVRFPGGTVTVGTDDRASAYDNERPRHRVEVAAFRIDVDPVSNGDFLIFIGAGGYQTREYWSAAGWAWLQEARV